MIDRRQLIVGGACLASAGSAAVLRPTRHLNIMGQTKLEQATPARFGHWSEVKVGQVIQPPEEDSLAARLYSQLLTRVYEHAVTGEVAMLAIAYGDTQSDLLQLHRPEACYPAFGFQLSESQADQVLFRKGVAIPTRSFVATVPGRTEYVTYWTRIGEFLPRSQSEQRVVKLRTAFAGLIPDGILVRCSTIGTSATQKRQMNERFLADLVLAVAPEHRPAFIGTTLAQGIAAKHLA